jgi:hypothetical protein
LLPTGFEDLEPFVATWALSTEPERIARRFGSGMADIQLFYDAMADRAAAALTHLDSFPLDEMPEAETRLLYLLLSLAEAASAVEVYGQPWVKYGFPTPDRYVPMHQK